jgi:acyl-CoA dehydrogenase
MDVHGGKGICLGPNNYLGRAYQQIPIGITVEGANILTRSMMIFGQGAIRCHPYVLEEIAATRTQNPLEASGKFDDAFWDHMRFVLANAARALWLGLTGARCRGTRCAGTAPPCPATDPPRCRFCACRGRRHAVPRWRTEA